MYTLKNKNKTKKLILVLVMIILCNFCYPSTVKARVS